MRNFRKAALAGATAVAVAFGSTSVAMADTEPKIVVDEKGAITRVHDERDGKGAATTSSKIGKTFGATDENGNPTGANGRVLFGLEKKDPETGADWNAQPEWAKAGYISTIFLAVSAAVGLIVGPLYNYFVHGM